MKNQSKSVLKRGDKVRVDIAMATVKKLLSESFISWHDKIKEVSIDLLNMVYCECSSDLCRKEMFYLTTYSTHFIYGYMASDIWLRIILIVRKETRCRHIGYSFRLTARVLLYAPSHRQDSTYHSLCYTSRGALAGMRNSSVGPPHEGSIQRPIAPCANGLTTELHLAPGVYFEFFRC